MKQRDFLKLLGLMVLGSGPVACGAGAGAGAGSSSKRRIIVIGAGLAGLAAAKDLQRNGHEVTVLEARDRIGGRIWTSGKWPDMPVDLGATWIHGVDGNPITTLADTIGANRLVTSYDNADTYTASGESLGADQQAQLEEISDAVEQALLHAQKQDPDVSFRKAVEALAHEYAGDAEATRLLNFVLSSEYEQEYSGSAHALSAQWFDSSEEFEGDDNLFARGFKVIVDHLAQGLNVQLGQVVKQVDWMADQVKVQTGKGEFTADQLVLTVPLGVLKTSDVRFVPELPLNKQTAISQLGMGVLNKCYLRFPQAFWPADVDWLEYIAPEHGAWTQWVSFQRVAKTPILLGFNAADRGRAIEAWTDQQIVDNAMLTLRNLFGDDIPQPTGYLISRWASDPYAKGSYSFNAVGSTPEMRDHLAAPLNKRLFFAGEATNKQYFGTAHGAYLSGTRVAQEVLAS